jgi:hypothetical protein
VSKVPLATVRRLRKAHDDAVGRLAMGSQLMARCTRCGGMVTVNRQRFAVVRAEPRCTCNAAGYELADDGGWVQPVGLLGEPLRGPGKPALVS